MNDEEKQRERMATAYHEAGHAVVAVYLECTVERVELTPGHPEREGLALSHDPKTTLPEEHDFDGMLPIIVRQCCVTDAGQLAEARYAGVQSHWTQLRDDHNSLLEMASLVTRGDEEAEAFLGWIRARTEQLVERLGPQNRAVAMALAERGALTGDEMLEVMRGTLSG
jgi:hypothetical protein